MADRHKRDSQDLSRLAGRRGPGVDRDTGSPDFEDFHPQGLYRDTYGRGFDHEGHLQLRGRPGHRNRDTERDRGQGRDFARGGPYSGVGPRSYRRSDKRIFDDVCERLSRHGHIDASEIEVKVENGEVTLDGHVPDRVTKRLAEYVSETVAGVHDVHNQLRIQTIPAAGRDEERHVDRVGHSGVHPGSGPLPPEDVETRTPGEWGRAK